MNIKIKLKELCNYHIVTKSETADTRHLKRLFLLDCALTGVVKIHVFKQAIGAVAVHAR